MGFGGKAGMERKTSYLAHRVCEWAVWSAVGQGLQGKHFTPLLWSHRNAVSNGISQQLIHRRIRVGIHAIAGEIAVLSITHQKALALQIPGDALRDQITSEIFYRVQVTQNLTITPSP